ncbi:MAG: isocitrate lyase/PEP mutase family protein [Sporolactobacillus sp.]
MLHLRNLVTQSEMLIVPSVFDSISARLSAHAGFQAAFVTSAGAEATLLASRNYGLLSMSERARHLRYIHEATTLPLFVDAESGYGNALNTFYTAQEFERSGAEAILLNDQTVPSVSPFSFKCAVIPTEEMVGKIRAAKDATENPDTLIGARTDCMAANGLEEALQRIAMYHEAGADWVSIGGLAESDQFHAVAPAAKKVPLALELETASCSVDQLAALGFRILFDSSSTLFAAIEAEQKSLFRLKNGLPVTQTVNKQVLAQAFDTDTIDQGGYAK